MGQDEVMRHLNVLPIDNLLRSERLSRKQAMAYRRLLRNVYRHAQNLARFDESFTGDVSVMTTKPRFPDSGENDLPRELVDLAKAIAALPDAQQRDLESIYGRVVESVKRRRRILALVQEALAQLRLDIKYLMFDLEVTRKERDELRERLD